MAVSGGIFRIVADLDVVAVTAVVFGDLDDSVAGGINQRVARRRVINSPVDAVVFVDRVRRRPKGEEMRAF